MLIHVLAEWETVSEKVPRTVLPLSSFLFTYGNAMPENQREEWDGDNEILKCGIAHKERNISHFPFATSASLSLTIFLKKAMDL